MALVIVVAVQTASHLVDNSSFYGQALGHNISSWQTALLIFPSYDHKHKLSHILQYSGPPFSFLDWPKVLLTLIYHDLYQGNSMFSDTHYFLKTTNCGTDNITMI